MSKTEKQTSTFTFSDIEDVRIIVKAKGSHWAIIPNGDKEDARQMRIALLGAILGDYCIVDKPLESLKSSPHV